MGKGTHPSRVIQSLSVVKLCEDLWVQKISAIESVYISSALFISQKLVSVRIGAARYHAKFMTECTSL